MTKTKQYVKTIGDFTMYFSDEAMDTLHREDGPAIEFKATDPSNDYSQWYINGEKVFEVHSPVRGRDAAIDGLAEGLRG